MANALNVSSEKLDIYDLSSNKHSIIELLNYTFLKYTLYDNDEARQIYHIFREIIVDLAVKNHCFIGLNDQGVAEEIDNCNKANYLTHLYGKIKSLMLDI